jgi:hypothetical protein
MRRTPGVQSSANWTGEVSSSSPASSSALPRDVREPADPPHDLIRPRAPRGRVRARVGSARVARAGPPWGGSERPSAQRESPGRGLRGARQSARGLSACRQGRGIRGARQSARRKPGRPAPARAARAGAPKGALERASESGATSASRATPGQEGPGFRRSPHTALLKRERPRRGSKGRVRARVGNRGDVGVGLRWRQGRPRVPAVALCSVPAEPRLAASAELCSARQGLPL